MRSRWKTGGHAKPNSGAERTTAISYLRDRLFRELFATADVAYLLSLTGSTAVWSSWVLRRKASVEDHGDCVLVTGQWVS